MEYIIIFGGIAVVCVIASAFHHLRMSRLAESRGDPDICSFARSFDCRRIDAKVIRAVFEYIQNHAGIYNGKRFPVRSEDSLVDVYGIDDEELEDVCDDIFTTVGVSWGNVQNNPYVNRIERVRDLVLFVSSQKLIS